MGWLAIKLDMATALVASVALGLSVDDTFHCLIQFHRERKATALRREPLRQLPGDRAGRPALQPGRGRRLRRAAGQRVRAVRQLRHDGRHRHRGQHARQSRPSAGVLDPGTSVADVARKPSWGPCRPRAESLFSQWECEAPAERSCTLPYRQDEPTGGLNRLPARPEPRTPERNPGGSQEESQPLVNSRSFVVVSGTAVASLTRRRVEAVTIAGNQFLPHRRRARRGCRQGKSPGESS